MMIEAKHNTAAVYLFRIYLDRLLRKNFSNFYLSNNFPELPKDKSVIITPIHISWWDGFFIHYIHRFSTNNKFHLMMLNKELERYWFFKYVGAYSISTENPVTISKTIKYTSKLLSDSSNTVVFYPQGEIEAFDKRPINIKRGLKLFIKEVKDECVVLIVGFKIQYYNEKYPAIIFRAGNVLQPNDILNNFSLFEEEFYSNLNALNNSAFNETFVRDLFNQK